MSVLIQLVVLSLVDLIINIVNDIDQWLADILLDKLILRT